MHVAAMSPSVLSAEELDHDFIVSETTALISRIEIENEDRKRTGKAFLHVPQYGSAAQLTDDVLAKVEAEFKEELKAEGKPEKSGTKSCQVKWLNSSLIIHKLTKKMRFCHNFTSWTTAKLLLNSLNLKMLKQLHLHVLKLAKVSKKLLTTLKLKYKQQWPLHLKINHHELIVRR
jgi:hypothetical protein